MGSDVLHHQIEMVVIFHVWKLNSISEKETHPEVDSRKDWKKTHSHFPESKIIMKWNMGNDYTE